VVLIPILTYCKKGATDDIRDGGSGKKDLLSTQYQRELDHIWRRYLVVDGPMRHSHCKIVFTQSQRFQHCDEQSVFQATDLYH